MANSADPDQLASDLHCLQGQGISGFSRTRVKYHTCHNLWTKICEIRQNIEGDLTKFCEIFLNITKKLPKFSLKVFFFSCKNLVKTTTVCNLCLFLHKLCCKMV